MEFFAAWFPGAGVGLDSAGLAFVLIGVAELGDKSQWVCMTLAARHPGGPVLAGAALAFAVLNAVAVLSGVALGAWVPGWIVVPAAAALFLIFGLLALAAPDGAPAAEDMPRPVSRRGRVLASTFSLIVLAEMGDKTQMATLGLGGTASPGPVWLGATAALVVTSALGVWAGRSLLRRLPLVWLQRLSGILFLLVAAGLFWRMPPADWTALGALLGRRVG